MFIEANNEPNRVVYTIYQLDKLNERNLSLYVYHFQDFALHQ